MTSSLPHSFNGILPYSQHTRADTKQNFSEYALKKSKNPDYKEKVIGNKTTGVGALTSLIDNSNKTYYTTGPFSKGYVSDGSYSEPLVGFDATARASRLDKDIFIISGNNPPYTTDQLCIYQYINVLDKVGQKGSLTFNTLTIFANNSYLENTGIADQYDQSSVDISVRIFKVPDYQVLSNLSTPITKQVVTSINGKGFYDISFDEDITITPFDENGNPNYYYIGIQLKELPTANSKAQLVFLRSIQGVGDNTPITPPTPNYTNNIYYGLGNDWKPIMSNRSKPNDIVIPGTLYFTLSKK